MKKLFQFIVLLIMGTAINSCYYDALPEETVDLEDPDTPTEVISYKTDIIPLWGQCVGCHSGNEAPDLRDANSYNALKNGYIVPENADASTLYKSLLGIDGVSLMPPGSKWSNTKIKLVKDWINQGALDN